MTSKQLNIIYCKEKIVLEYFTGTECDALMQTIKGRFQLDHSSFYLTEPKSNKVVALSSSMPDKFTVIVHSVKHPNPDIEEHDNTEDEVTDSESGESAVTWGGSPEYSEHEDDFKEDVKKYKDDENMQEVIKRRRLSSSSSSEIFSYIPRPPSPPRSRCPIPPPPVARNVKLSAKSE